MSDLALDLNETISEASPAFFSVLSQLGRQMFFPAGILTQTAEAKEKAHKIDATIGIAKEKGKAMFLPEILKHAGDLSPDEALDYAPATGNRALRGRWLERIVQKNPSLKNASLSLPIITSGITHGLSICADIFTDPSDIVILPDKHWGNYRMIFQTRRGAEIRFFPFFNSEGGFNVEELVRVTEASLEERGKAILLLNFPNNPTGYSLKEVEASNLTDCLAHLSSQGGRIVVLVDDAYFGFNYEPDVISESVFSYLVGKSETLFPVKLDGATKELFAWGVRVAFITFSISASGKEQRLYDALEKKIGGLIRATVSNSPQISQSIVLKALEDPDISRQEHEKYLLLKRRAAAAKECAYKSEYRDLWEPYNFNSGYFMCVRMKHTDARDFRVTLLDKYGIGLIAENETDVRIAFAGVDEEEIPLLFDIMSQCAQEMRSGT